MTMIGRSSSSSAAANTNTNDVLLLTVCSAAVIVSITSFVSGYMLKSWTLSRTLTTKGTKTETKRNENKNNVTNKSAAATTPEEAEAKLWTYAEGALSVAILQAADQLDLFEVLVATGPITSSELASKQQWNERYLREVLLQLCGAGICQYNTRHQTFGLRSVFEPLLRDPDRSKKSLVGLMPFVSALVRRTSTVVQAVQTGLGSGYDLNGSDINDAINRKNKNFFRTTLIDDVLPTIVIPQSTNHHRLFLIERLESGINVADIGCGYGASTISMAKKFPKSKFYAFESSESALNAIRHAVRQNQLDNVVVCDVSERTVADGPDTSSNGSNNEQQLRQISSSKLSDTCFDFVYAHDVLHDMTNPRRLIQDVKKRLEPNHGCWFIVDINCKATIEENINQPKAAMLYAFSCLLCLSNSTSTPDGEGLGTCGFPPTLAKEWMMNAGFQHFEKIQVSALPYNACYLIA